jgi:hypothetical protein
MLALDGGGIRGLITLGILEKIEKVVKEKTRKKLGEYFDYIAGTSTGAIVAAGLSRGLEVADLIEFYRSSGKQMFDHARLIERIKYLYTADPLKAQLQNVYGHDTNLEPDNLKCLLLVVTKNVTTDSAWPISSNPDAKYNDPDRKECNWFEPAPRLLFISLPRLCNGTKQISRIRSFLWMVASQHITIRLSCSTVWQLSRLTSSTGRRGRTIY